ncbi:unnamed protein product, partial [Rotaria sp. Silwood2]
NGEVVTNGQEIADGDSTSVPVDDMEQQQKIERLQELEHKLIGGEEANNEERKKKRKKKLNEMREKLEQRKRLSKAINADGDDTLLKVFDNAQEERKDKVSNRDQHGIKLTFDTVFLYKTACS